MEATLERSDMGYVFRVNKEKRLLHARILDPVIVDSPGDDFVRLTGFLVDPETGSHSDVQLALQISHENVGLLVRGLQAAAKANGWVLEH
jgi:hypothetical protein